MVLELMFLRVFNALKGLSSCCLLCFLPAMSLDFAYIHYRATQEVGLVIVMLTPQVF